MPGYKKYYDLTKSKTLIAVNLLSLIIVLFGLLYIILDIKFIYLN